MTVLMVRLIGLAGAFLFLAVLLAGACVVLTVLKDLVMAPRRRDRMAAHAGDVPAAGQRTSSS